MVQFSWWLDTPSIGDGMRGKRCIVLISRKPLLRHIARYIYHFPEAQNVTKAWNVRECSECSECPEHER
jgi:hypothetical protein